MAGATRLQLQAGHGPVRRANDRTSGCFLLWTVVWLAKLRRVAGPRSIYDPACIAACIAAGNFA